MDHDEDPVDDLDRLLEKASVLASQTTAKKGRRAAKNPEPQRSFAGDETEELNIEGFDFNKSSSKSGDSAQPRPSRRGGWGTESIDSGKDKKRKDAGGDYEDARLRAKTPPQDDDSDSDIPAIPELKQDNEVAERLEDQVAVAPHVVMNRVATYKELDTDLIQHNGFLSLDNEIDLKLLSKALFAQADILEDDVPWEWDHLFTEVSSELLAEWETSNKRHEE